MFGSISDKNSLRLALKSTKIAKKEVKDVLICNAIAKLPELENLGSIYAFMPLADEPQIAPCLRGLLAQGKRVAVPVCSDADTYDMTFAEVVPGEKYVAGRFGISVPLSPKAAEFPPDVILVPMVAFDNQKNRLGRGKGYYDRFLGGVGTGVLKIGISYSDRKVQSVFAEPHDVKLDMILTDEEIIR